MWAPWSGGLLFSSCPAERELRSSLRALSPRGPRPPSCGCSADLKVSPGAAVRARRPPAPSVRALGGQGRWPWRRCAGRSPWEWAGVRAAAGRGRCYSNARANGQLGLLLRVGWQPQLLKEQAKPFWPLLGPMFAVIPGCLVYLHLTPPPHFGT